MGFGTAEIKRISGGWAQGNKRTYTMVLQLLGGATDKYNGVGAMLANGVPRIWDAFDPDGTGAYGDDRSFCVSKTFEQPDPVNKGSLFLVTCQFETLTREQKKRIDHPLDRPAEISDGANIFTRFCDKDTSGNAILNKANQPFDPPVEADDARLAVTVTRNFAERLNSLAYINRVNDTEFLGGAAGTVKIQDFQQTRKIEEYGEGDEAEEIEYWEVTVVFEYNPDGWQKSTLNAGRYQLAADGSLDQTDVRDDPWPLDNSGQFIDSASLPGAETYVDSDVYYEANFDSIGLFA